MCCLKKIISGQKLICCEVINMDVTLPKSDYILITGKVISPSKEPLCNAAITVFSIDDRCSPAEKKYVGITFSDEYGNYGVSISRNSEVSYEFKAYGSIYE
ncbi:hypothetical protein UT300005_07030 [Clostridium sp. CTA-5]